MRLFSTAPSPQKAATSRQKVQGKLDRLRAGASEVKDKDAALSADVAAVRRDLHEAVEVGDPVAQKELTAKLSRLNADLDANRTVGEITESSLATAEKELADLLAWERLERGGSVLEEEEKALEDARDEVRTLFVPFAVSRGRVIQLEERVARLRREYRALGGQAPRPGDEGTFRSSSVEIAFDALRAKYGDRVRHDNGDTRGLGAYVLGLAGPEPKV